jgi:hypothetical protein
LRFSEFLELLKTEAKVSFYLEYCSIPSSLPRMMADIADGFAWADFLDREMTNIWLGNGRTLGKLHFDPFDNLLCQICTLLYSLSALWHSLHVHRTRHTAHTARHTTRHSGK